MKKLSALILLLLCFINTFAQIGGRFAYEFLNLTSSPKVAALGGKFISQIDDDLSLTYHNPSLLNSSMDQHLSMNYVNYFAGVKYGYASYARRLSEKDNVALGMQYINYGTFIAADATGTITGTFAAGEYALNMVFSRKLDSCLTIGADIRNIYSVYERYSSYGLSTDWGLTYQNIKELYTVALVFRNLGTQIKPYTTGGFEKLPFEVQLGFTKKLRYAPFSFSVTAQHLETPDMSVPDYETDATDITGSATKRKSVVDKIADEVMRHLIFGAEFNPFTNFYVRGGYNYQRRQELKIDAKTYTVGFSWGVGLTISSFQISYGRATYHLAGASNHFSIATDLSRVYHRKQKRVISSENF